jgi:hypothetical protein
MSGVLAITAGLLIIGGLLGIAFGLQRRTSGAVSPCRESAAERWARVTRRPAVDADGGSYSTHRSLIVWVLRCRQRCFKTC